MHRDKCQRQNQRQLTGIRNIAKVKKGINYGSFNDIFCIVILLDTLNSVLSPSALKYTPF
jgi:hypothetical protein